MAKNAKPADQGKNGQTGAATEQSGGTGSESNGAPNTESPAATLTPPISQTDGLPDGGDDEGGHEPGGAGNAGAADAGQRSAVEAVRAMFPPPIFGIEVVAMRDGYRRAGRAWTTTPQVVPIADFTEEQIEQLRGDRDLMHRIVEMDTAGV